MDDVGIQYFLDGLLVRCEIGRRDLKPSVDEVFHFRILGIQIPDEIEQFSLAF